MPNSHKSQRKKMYPKRWTDAVRARRLSDMGSGAVPGSSGGYNLCEKAGNVYLYGYNLVYQCCSNWCWAAVTTAVTNYYSGGSVNQCTVVNTTLGRSDCCEGTCDQSGCYGGICGPGNCSSAACNVDYYLPDALYAMHHLNVWIGGTISVWGSDQSVISQLSSMKPIGARIVWSGGGAHFLAIIGCQCSGAGAEPILSVADPIFGPSSPTYTNLCTNYLSSGHWVETTLTKP
jgi:hypothetical protein